MLGCPPVEFADFPELSFSESTARLCDLNTNRQRLAQGHQVIACAIVFWVKPQSLPVSGLGLRKQTLLLTSETQVVVQIGKIRFDANGQPPGRVLMLRGLLA